MTVSLAAEAPPIRREISGTLCVGNTRIALEHIVDDFKGGATPEQIVEEYESLTLADVYAVITHYLRHRDEVEDYLAERERIAAAAEARSAGRNADLAGLRARLLARQRA